MSKISTTIRLSPELVKRVKEWLKRTQRDAHGAFSREIERMIEEGIKRRERRAE